MQTFLPYPDFMASAKVLDDKRLGKQRVECLQILRCLAGLTDGWKNHPAVKMWRGNPSCLSVYGITVCKEWRGRGFKDTVLISLYNIHPDGPPGSVFPSWLGNPAFHAAHRAALLAKDPEHYGQFRWTEEPKIEYIWPV